MSKNNILKVVLTASSYGVFIGSGIRKQLSGVIPQDAKRVALVVDQGLLDSKTGPMADADWGTGLEERVFAIPSSEENKSLENIQKLSQGFVEFGLTRSDVVLGVGGGLISDIAGFTAAIYHRGVKVIFMPTTLLAQVDAAIGGKNGVNLPQGKNLLGTFHQPLAVFCDVDFLDSLPEREIKSGMGEVAKYHFLSKADLSSMSLEQKIHACAKIKAEIVSKDEKDRGIRFKLNYGHTLAHALEVAGKFDLRHGEAVALGLVYAAETAFLLKRIPKEKVEEHYRVVGNLGLSTSLQGDFDTDELLLFMLRDKKSRGDLTMVLDGPKGLEQVRQLPEDILKQALEKMKSQKREQ